MRAMTHAEFFLELVGGFQLKQSGIMLKTGGWSNYNDAFASILKLYAAGSLNYLSVSFWNTGSYGSYLSSNQYYQYPNPDCWYFGISNTSCDMYKYSKAIGQSIQCIRD